MGRPDSFLKITGIQGESRDAAHRNEIEVESWSWGLVKPTVTTPGTASRAVFREFTVQKRVDRSSPRLAQGCATGEHFQEAVLTSQHAEGPDFSHGFLVVKLNDLVISRYEAITEPQSFPSDSLVLSFSRIEYSYSVQKADGTVDIPLKWSWDLKTNKAP